MDYTLRYDIRVQDDLRSISSASRERIRASIEEKLMTQPTLFGKPLRHSLVGFRVLRVGSYRIVYVITESVVTVLLIGDRKRVYQEALKRVG